MITTEDYKEVFTPDPGGQTEFSFSFPFSLVSDIKVEWYDTDGSRTDLYYIDLDFDIASSDFSSGGTVTTKNSYNSGTLVIYRKPDYKQHIDILKSMPQTRQTEEAGFDRITMMSRALKAIVERSIKRPLIDDADMGMPALSERQNQKIGFDSGGSPEAATEETIRTVTPSTIGRNVLEAADADEAQGDTGINAAIRPILDDANAETACFTIGINDENLPVDDVSEYSSGSNQSVVNEEMLGIFGERRPTWGACDVGDPVGFSYNGNVAKKLNRIISSSETVASETLAVEKIGSLITRNGDIVCGWYSNDDSKVYIAAYDHYEGSFTQTDTKKEITGADNGIYIRFADLNGSDFVVLYENSGALCFAIWEVDSLSGTLTEIVSNTQIDTANDMDAPSVCNIAIDDSHSNKYIAFVWENSSTVYARIGEFDASSGLFTWKTSATSVGTGAGNSCAVSPVSQPIGSYGSASIHYFAIYGDTTTLLKYVVSTSTLTVEGDIYSLSPASSGPISMKSKGGDCVTFYKFGRKMYVLRYNQSSKTMSILSMLFFTGSNGGGAGFINNRQVCYYEPGSFLVFRIDGQRLELIHSEANNSYQSGYDDGGDCVDSVAVMPYSDPTGVLKIRTLTFPEYIGLSTRTVSAGTADLVFVQKKGIISGLSGLIPGADYYYSYEESKIKSSYQSGEFIGVAISETELLLR